MTISRNDPCPCGSTKKAKSCCLQSCCPDCLASLSYKDLRQKGWLLEKSLIRINGRLHMPICPHLSSFKPKTIVICGNGAVGSISNRTNDPKGNNVWNLIQEAVSEFKTTPFGKGVGIPSLHINCLHWAASTERLIAYYGAEKPGSMDQALLTPSTILRQIIAKKLANATIRLRTVECFGCSCNECLPVSALDSCGIITLNWDTAVQQLPHTIHLHGKVDHPDCLVLPNQDFIKLQPQNGKINQGFGSFHTARNWLDECQNVLLWGCRFNDYDSILLTVLTSATIAKQKHLNFFICNPNKSDLQEKLFDYFPLANFTDCLTKFKKLI